MPFLTVMLFFMFFFVEAIICSQQNYQVTIEGLPITYFDNTTNRIEFFDQNKKIDDCFNQKNEKNEIILKEIKEIANNSYSFYIKNFTQGLCHNKSLKEIQMFFSASTLYNDAKMYIFRMFNATNSFESRLDETNKNLFSQQTRNLFSNLVTTIGDPKKQTDQHVARDALRTFLDTFFENCNAMHDLQLTSHRKEYYFSIALYVLITVGFFNEYKNRITPRTYNSLWKVFCTTQAISGIILIHSYLPFMYLNMSKKEYTNTYESFDPSVDKYFFDKFCD